MRWCFHTAEWLPAPPLPVHRKVSVGHWENRKSNRKNGRTGKKTEKRKSGAWPTHFIIKQEICRAVTISETHTHTHTPKTLYTMQTNRLPNTKANNRLIHSLTDGMYTINHNHGHNRVFFSSYTFTHTHTRHEARSVSLKVLDLVCVCASCIKKSATWSCHCSHGRYLSLGIMAVKYLWEKKITLNV